MNTIISLNQIVKLFKDFTTNHLQLKSFGYGPTSDIGTSVKVDYPACWLTHTEDSTLQVLNKNIAPELRFTVLFFDKINMQHNVDNVNGEAADNGQEVLSDTFQYGQDLINEIMTYWGHYGIMLNGDVNASPIMDETDDKVNGFQFNISLRLKHYNCAMQIGNVSIIHPTQIDFITCDTLPDCPSFATLQSQVDDLVVDRGLTCDTIGDCSTIQDIVSDVYGNTYNINNIQNDIRDIQNDINDIITGSTGPSSGLTCDELSGCTIITDIQQDISTLQGDIGGLQDDINYISGETSTNTSNINTNAGNINTNTGDISNLDSRVGDNEQDIAELKALTGDTTPFDCNELSGCTIITDIQQDINTIEGDISTAQDDINYISGATSSNTSDIGLLEGRVGANEGDISQLQSDVAGKIDCDDLATCPVIQGIGTDIGNLQDSVGDIEGNLLTFYIAIDFADTSEFSYVAPEGYKINSIDNPNTLTLTIEVEGLVYTIGDDITLYDRLTITPSGIGFIKLNCTKI